MLIAQELTYYGLDIYKKRELPKLLHALADVKGMEWIRLHYAYPSKFPLEIIDAMKLGAVDFLWKPFDYTQLVQVIDDALRLDVQRTNDQKRLVRVAALHQSLSPREKDIINLMLLGYGNKDIASARSLMADTVKKHRAQIFEKMHVQSLAELLALCKDFIPTQG
jgi:DNA-binding CsgD family transcriptional regulator